MEFKKIKIKDIEGKDVEIEFDYKGLANYIFSKTADIGELELARELYKNGKIDVDKDIAHKLKEYIKSAFGPLVQESIIPTLDKIINN